MLYVYQSIPAQNMQLFVHDENHKNLARLLLELGDRSGRSVPLHPLERSSLLKKINRCAAKVGLRSYSWEGGRALASDLTLRSNPDNGGWIKTRPDLQRLAPEWDSVI